jgi:hypothetical protein
MYRHFPRSTNCNLIAPYLSRFLRFFASTICNFLDAMKNEVLLTGITRDVARRHVVHINLEVYDQVVGMNPD